MPPFSRILRPDWSTKHAQCRNEAVLSHWPNLNRWNVLRKILCIIILRRRDCLVEYQRAAGICPASSPSHHHPAIAPCLDRRSRYIIGYREKRTYINVLLKYVPRTCVKYLCQMPVSNSCITCLCQLPVPNAPLSMPVSNVGVKCLCQMPVSNACPKRLCQLPVPNACVKFLFQMPVSNACIKCLCQMPVLNACMKCRCQMPVANASAKCLYPEPASNACIQTTRPRPSAG